MGFMSWTDDAVITGAYRQISAPFLLFPLGLLFGPFLFQALGSLLHGMLFLDYLLV